MNKDDVIATIYASIKPNDHLIELFINNIDYYAKREEITIKNYFQDAFDNLNLIKVIKNKDDTKS